MGDVPVAYFDFFTKKILSKENLRKFVFFRSMGDVPVANFDFSTKRKAICLGEPKEICVFVLVWVMFR